jgi:hypothetical protein
MIINIVLFCREISHTLEGLMSIPIREIVTDLLRPWRRTLDMKKSPSDQFTAHCFALKIASAVPNKQDLLEVHPDLAQANRRSNLYSPFNTFCLQFSHL